MNLITQHGIDLPRNGIELPPSALNDIQAGQNLLRRVAVSGRPEHRQLAAVDDVQTRKWNSAQQRARHSGYARGTL